MAVLWIYFLIFNPMAGILIQKNSTIHIINCTKSYLSLFYFTKFKCIPKLSVMRQLAITLVLLFIMILGLFAQSPQKINYQAVVRHSNGEIIKDSQISMKISLREGGIEGESIYSEIHQLSTNEFGMVNLAIGTGDSDQDFKAIEWGDNNGIWIRIELDSDGGTAFELMGGMELLSVPYSFYASEAGSAPPVLQSLTDIQRQLLGNPAQGLMILNTTTNMVNVFKTDGWYELGGDKISESFSCGQYLIDSRDGQVYNTIQIGDQCWMAENLNVGDMIEGSLEQSDNDVIEKYCYQDSPAFCDTYGALYQWDEMMGFSTVKSSQGICPDGWHIPSDQEVQDMEVALGMDSTTAALTNVWRGSDEGTQMALGGSAGYETLYSGRRVTGGMYSAIENYEYLWTSSEAGNNAWRRCLRVADPRVGRYNTFPKIYGMSVRCIEN